MLENIFKGNGQRNNLPPIRKDTRIFKKSGELKLLALAFPSVQINICRNLPIIRHLTQIVTEKQMTADNPYISCRHYR
jgi:hypothetical protein